MRALGYGSAVEVYGDQLPVGIVFAVGDDEEFRFRWRTGQTYTNGIACDSVAGVLQCLFLLAGGASVGP